jgi:hypothetical protein
MMKKMIFILACMMISLVACSQDQTFNKPVYFNAGFYLNGVLYTTISTGGVADWNTMINKPATFPPSAHNHDLLYKPIGYVPTWVEITGKPQEIPLQDAIDQLGYLPVPSKTTAQINALVIPTGKRGVVFDNTLGVYKLYDGTTWSKIVITNQ